MRPVSRADNLTTFMCWLSCDLVVSPFWNPQGWSRPVMGLLYLGYSYTECCCTKYEQISTNRVMFCTHIQHALRWNTLFQLVHGFPPEVCSVIHYWLSFCLTWHWIWRWSDLPACWCLFTSRHSVTFWIPCLHPICCSVHILSHWHKQTVLICHLTFILVQSNFTWCASGLDLVAPFIPCLWFFR